jgi:hypothetical protein
MKKLLSVIIFYIAFSAHAQVPTITSFSPTSGFVGGLVTINGTNLGSPTAFTIGGTTAIVISNTGTTLVGLVMPGTTTGVVSLTTSAGIATSISNFTIKTIPNPYAYAQQGGKLVDTSAVSGSSQGCSVSLSADGNTAIVGGNGNNSGVGAAWIYTRSGNIWAQQGSKLVGTGAIGTSSQGCSVSLSADGNTAIVGGNGNNSGVGAAWIYTRSGNIWVQQGSRLVGTGASGIALQGSSVSLSADGNIAIVGGSNDNFGVGAVWVFTRTGVNWTQQGSKLVGTGAVGGANQGASVSLSANGNTLIVGGNKDNSNSGAAWIFTRNGSTWTQQGNKLVGTGSVGSAGQGCSVSLSSNGNTAIVGGNKDNSNSGAAWIYTRSGSNWTQQGSKLVGSPGYYGSSVSLSADGNTAIVGGTADNSFLGAAWAYTRSGSTWTQQGSKLVGTGAVGGAEQGISVSLSSDGNTAIVGGWKDNFKGASWIFTKCSSNANLSALTSTDGNLNPTFSSATTNYYASVGYTTTSVALTPTLADTTASIQIRINGGIYKNVTNGTASSFLELNMGVNYVEIKVTAQDGNTIKIYTITFKRDLSLSSLITTAGNLSPAFSAATTYYTASVINETTSVTVTPTLADTTGSIKVRINAGTYSTVPSGIPSSALSLNVGSNLIEVKVTAQDGITVRIDTIDVTRAASPPLITSYTPDSVKIGSVISLTGKNFYGLTEFTIGGTSQLILNSTDTTLVGLVMPGTNSGPISLVNYIGSGGDSSQVITIVPSLSPNYQDYGLGGAWQSRFGSSVSISADGNTAIIGSPTVNAQNKGSATVYVRQNKVWIQQSVLYGSGVASTPQPWQYVWPFQGSSVAISADGNTAMVGGPGDNIILGVGAPQAGVSTGSVWVFVRNNGIWSQQGSKLTVSGKIGNSISISADGNTAIFGSDSGAWIFKRSGTNWNGIKLSGFDGFGSSNQGQSVAISANGKVAIVGGGNDDGGIGAAWVFRETGGNWYQHGTKIIGSGAIGLANQGSSVSINADGSTVILGGPLDSNGRGAAWVFKQLNPISSYFQRSKIVGQGSVGSSGQGGCVSLSADGNIAVVGGSGDNSNTGAIWVYSDVTNNSPVGLKLVSKNATAGSGIGSISLSANGNTVVVGCPSSGSMSDGSAYFFNGYNIQPEGNINSYTSCFPIGNVTQNIVISGRNLSSNINLSTPNGFKISKFPETGFTNNISLSQVNGVVPQTNIYFKPDSMLLPGVYSPNINCSSIGSDTILIPISCTIYASPIAGFGVNKPIQCINGNEFRFDDTTSISDGGIRDIVWSFGDSSSSSNGNPIKTYQKPSTYQVKLLVTSWDGCADSSIKSVVVNPNPFAGFVIDQDTQCLNGNSFMLIDTTKIVSGLFTRKWDFGDGSYSDTSSSNVIYKTYSSSNTHNIKFTAISNMGCKDSLSKFITVLPSPLPAGLIAGKINDLQTATPYLYNINQQNGVSYNWIVNNAAIVSGQGTNAVTIQWINNGLGKLTVVIINPSGCTDTSTISVGVGTQPGLVSFNPTSAKSGEVVTINGFNLSNATAVKFGGVNAQSFNVISSNKIEAVVGNGSTGDVTVVTPNGNISLAGFTYIPTTGLFSKTLFSGLQIYPNPTKQSLTIDFGSIKTQGVVYIQIHDMLGRLVYDELLNEQSINEHTILVSGLSIGNYILTIKTNDKIDHMKFVKE